MSLSFKDSLVNNTINNVGVTKKNTNIVEENVEAPTVMAYSLRSAPMMLAANENWTPIQNQEYRFYNNEYSDEGYSTIDELKNISLDPKQFNITQERNSQYIPFQMPRYYDGFDLSRTRLSIYYVNENKDAHSDIPVDVYYNDEYIRFAWLVSEFATQVAGVLKFEIHADGVNNKGESYTWKSKSIDKLNVLQSLEDVALGEIGVSEEELESWYNRIQLQTQYAQQAAIDAQSSANEAARLVADLRDGITEEVENAVDTKVESVVDNKISDQLLNYYTKAETYDRDTIEEKIAAVKPDGYATIEYVDGKIDEVNSKFGTLVGAEGTELEGIELTVEKYVRQEVDAVDVSEELGDLGTNEDGTTKTVVQYVNEAIESQDITGKLGNYYTKSETYNKDEIDDALSNVEVDLSDYATKQYVTNETGSLSSSIETNTENISSLSTLVGDLQSEVNSIDKSPRKTYDIVYNDVEDENSGENVLVLYEIENENKEGEVKSVKRKYTITGGSGGSTSSNKLTLYYDKDAEDKNITLYNFTAKDFDNKEAVVYYDFSGTDSAGDDIPYANGVWQIRMGTSGAWSTILTEPIYPAENIEFNISKYISSIGTYTLRLSVSDDTGGYASKTWTIKYIDFTIKSTFNDAYQYSGNVSFNYTPYGDTSKVIHFILDGEEIGSVTTSTSGIPTSYTIPSQTHGSHLLDVYMTATIGDAFIESNHVYKDIIWFDSISSIPVIGCATPIINMTQYNTVNIKYSVIDPNTETPEVVWYIGDEIVSVETLTEKDQYGYYTYSYKANDAGTFVLTITCGEAEPKIITINVEELDIDVSPVTAGLEFDFNPVGYSNSSSDRLWSYNNVSMSVSENFDWVNGGYQIDEKGDQYFCIKAGTTATINYNLFADDPKKNGKEFKTIFRTKNIRKRNTSFLTCLNGGIGLDMKVENATVYNSGGSLRSDYCEDTIIEYEFNINKDTDMMIVMSYEDGTPSKPCEYTETSSFKQSSPQPITIGSVDCDVHIYRMKAYSNSLTDTDIKNNFIADARNADEIIARYNRNQIYNESGSLISTSANGDFNVDALMKAAPDLRYIFLEVPQFTNDKDNKIDGCTVYFRYPNGTRPQDNWKCTGMRHRGQGTSSNLYGYSGRNIDLCMDRSSSLFTWEDKDEDGKPITVESSTITLTDTSVPTDYLNIKVNIASSENANNAQMARRFNEYQPFLRYARKKNSRVKDTMEFYNCVVFIRETSTDLSTTPHREFNDNNWHFYAIGNVGDSKKTDDTRVNNANDPKEHIIEITDADKPLSAFPTGKEGHSICPVEEWRDGNTAYDILHSTEYVYDEEGAFESFGGTTYEFRYEMEDITEEQREENINAWRNLYKFIVTSTDEEFHANLKNYFVVDSALYYYLFTERYTMVDNRAKNSFWHYGKVYISETEAAELGEVEASYYIIDNDAATINNGYRYDLTFGYDMDTSLGIDNTGDYVFSYGKEDTDYYVDGDPTSDYVFRVADSVFFCRLRDLFPSELQVMFKNREEKNAWVSTSLINQWDNSQAQFPEELWRLDYERKYYRTYLGLSIDNSISQGVDKTFLIGKFFGRKKYARRAFEINQEIYFATKYFGNKALEDVFWIRGNVPIGSDIKPNYSLTLVPYSDMYVCVQYTSTGTPIHQKVKAGETCFFENNAERMDFVYVYAASFIQEVGDLSRCYVGDNNFSTATRLQKLVIGSTDDGYENTFMKEVLVSNNPLLEHLDLRNISGINTVINVSACGNLKELYAEGTNATGVIFANGGLLQTAHLPNTIASLSMKNLNYIEDFVVDGGYNNLQSLTVENCPAINTYEMITNAPLLRLLRLINLNWDSTYQLNDASIFDRLLIIGGIDSSAHETDVSVLTGNAYVNTIKEQQLYKYTVSWSDLKIDYPESGFIRQYAVTFLNADDTPLLDTDGIPMVQYVDVNGYASDPSTYDENGIPTFPTIESTVEYDYTFAKQWVYKSTGDVFDFKTPIREPIILKATYTQTLRKYKINYVTKTQIISDEGYYGSNIVYDYEKNGIPYYTGEENANTFYLFSHWDKSGFLLEGEDGKDLDGGVKIVNAVYDKFQYRESGTGFVEQNTDTDINGSYTVGNFKGLELNDLSPIHIYALTKLGVGTVPMGQLVNGSYLGLQDGDPYTIEIGNDVDYSDIESDVLISGETSFGNSNYNNTGIQLFDFNKDFVLAIDYKFLGQKSGTLAQCLDSSGSGRGFKLSYNGSNVQFAYDGTTTNITAANKHEMIVIRNWKKEDTGEYILTIYNSNLDNDNVSTVDFNRTKVVDTNASLIFGASYSYSEYGNFVDANINWAKIWYKDLGDDACTSLAMWTHETINMQVCGFRRYVLSGNTTRCSFSLLATNLLERTKTWNGTQASNGAHDYGWAGKDGNGNSLNKFLNTRLYNAIPIQIRYLLKPMIVWSNDGLGSRVVDGKTVYYTDVTSSICYITIPALVELHADYQNVTPYKDEMNNGQDGNTWKTISYINRNEDRIKTLNDGVASIYWTRSPSADHSSSYVYCVEANGTVYAIGRYSYNSYGVLIEISF